MITVGLPFANSAGTLPLAVQSVIEQSFQDWEMVLLDDGSSDGSLAIARGFEDPRISVVSDGSNRGLPARLNEIARSSNRAWMARMDADDVMHPVRLATQLAYGGIHDLDVVGSTVYVINEQNVVYGVKNPGPLPGTSEGYLRNGAFVHPSVIGLTSWFVANPYNESLRRAQDKELWLRTHAHSRFGKVDIPLLYYREMGNFRLGLYRATCRADRQILRQYAPQIIGARRALQAVVKSYGKEGLNIALSGTRAHTRLMQARSVVPNGSTLADGQRVLDALVVHLNHNHVRPDE